MKLSRRFVLVVATFIVAVVTPCFGQNEAPTSQSTPAVTGTGQTNHIPVWKSSTTLGNSAIVSTGGNVGIGTSAPVAKLEVNGNAQVDGNFSLSGSILENDGFQLLWAP